MITNCNYLKNNLTIPPLSSAALALVLLWGAGCSPARSGPAPRTGAKPAKAAPQTSPDAGGKPADRVQPRAPSAAAKPAQKKPAPAPDAGVAPAPAGSIRRSELKAYLKGGPHQLISRIRVKPVFRKGRFFGWRVLSYRGPGPIKQGDVLLSVNDRPIERPDQFMATWSKVGKRDDLVVRLMRAGLVHVLRYPIVD